MHQKTVNIIKGDLIQQHVDT